jgi:hypothetical protein
MLLSQLSQPTKKIAGTLPGGAVWAGDEGSETIAVAVLRPAVEHLRVLKVLTLGIGLGHQQRGDRGGRQEKSAGAISEHGNSCTSLRYDRRRGRLGVIAKGQEGW